ncbi:hypothetical protein VNO77_41990 [Canavalia gladiata]|uniref:Uncharacterized protein n=1 Tax=Canavalia gladiata TaxID=3824 RepID=A0AAN9K1Y4_CANGL
MQLLIHLLSPCMLFYLVHAYVVAKPYRGILLSHSPSFGVDPQRSGEGSPIFTAPTSIGRAKGVQCHPFSLSSSCKGPRTQSCKEIGLNLPLRIGQWTIRPLTYYCVPSLSSSRRRFRKQGASALEQGIVLGDEYLHTIELEMMKGNGTDLHKNRVKSFFLQRLIDPNPSSRWSDSWKAPSLT